MLENMQTQNSAWTEPRNKDCANHQLKNQSNDIGIQTHSNDEKHWLQKNDRPKILRDEKIKKNSKRLVKARLNLKVMQIWRLQKFSKTN